MFLRQILIVATMLMSSYVHANNQAPFNLEFVERLSNDDLKDALNERIQNANEENSFQLLEELIHVSMQVREKQRLNEDYVRLGAYDQGTIEAFETRADECSAKYESLTRGIGKLLDKRPEIINRAFNTLVSEVNQNPKSFHLNGYMQSQVFRIYIRQNKGALVPIDAIENIQSKALYLQEVFSFGKPENSEHMKNTIGLVIQYIDSLAATNVMNLAEHLSFLDNTDLKLYAVKQLIKNLYSNDAHISKPGISPDFEVCFRRIVRYLNMLGAIQNKNLNLISLDESRFLEDLTRKYLLRDGMITEIYEFRNANDKALPNFIATTLRRCSLVFED